ncbi:MAG TPA: DUF4097 family beta strand repeat-containing protein [Aggregatilineaceae bacterium]|nr:DUF4097 family beta strand repeat-containing protein [Aggregatilineaceae bacterium]
MSRPKMLVVSLLISTIVLAACNHFGSSGENKQASESGTETITLTSDTVTTLDVRGEVGTITIRAGASGQVQVDYTKTAYAKTEDDAREEAKNMTVKVEQQDASVWVDAIQTQYRDHTNTNSVDLTISVPASTNLTVQTEVGDVNISGITSPDKLIVTGDVGDLTLTDVVAPAGMSLKNDVGDVSFAGTITGTGSCAITTSTGDIDVKFPADIAIQLDAAADVGNIDVNDVSAPSDSDPGAVWTSMLGTGDDLPTLTLRTDVGSITVAAQ